MVELRKQREFSFMSMQMPSQEVIDGEIELERLRFDRHEAGSRAILRLRLALNATQIAALDELTALTPEYPQSLFFSEFFQTMMYGEVRDRILP